MQGTTLYILKYSKVTIKRDSVKQTGDDLGLLLTRQEAEECMLDSAKRLSFELRDRQDDGSYRHIEESVTGEYFSRSTLYIEEMVGGYYNQPLAPQCAYHEWMRGQLE